LQPTVYGPPAVALAVTVPVVAVPPVIVAGLPAIVLLAPLAGAGECYFTTITGSPNELVTVTANGLANVVLINAL
jgi:hypothetical protein